jgi:methionyl-tRNA synthetase
MPDTAARIAELLNADPKPLAEPAPAWFTSYADGHGVQAAEPLFPRIDVDGK